MALITNNISGSISDLWRIGITGSVKFGNPGGDNNQTQLPDFPGTDVSFFVSGSRGGKGGPNRTVAVFGGDAVISGSLTVGTGSITITSNEIQFGNGAARIISGSGGLTFIDSTGGTKTLASLSTGGSGGSNFFTETSNGVIYSSGTIAFTGARTGESITAASDKGTDVVFYFSGSNASIGTAASNATLFGGNLVSSGSLLVKTAAGVVASISNNGVISGSSNLQAGGTLTVAGNSTLGGTLSVTGTSSLAAVTATTVSGSGNFQVGGNITLQGDLDSDANESKTLFGTVGAGSTITVGGASSTVRIPGNLTVQGTTTTIDTNQLVIEDPLIYFASGSITSNQNGGIAIASGSSVTDQALVWGRVASDTWGAGRQDVTAGTTSDLTSMTLVPIRASKFEIGGPGAFLTSSDGNALTASVVASNPFLFSFGSVPFAELAESGADAKFGSIGTKSLILSGAGITLLGGPTGTIFQRDTQIIGSVTGISSTNMTVAARTGASTATSLVLTGSGITLGANSSTIDFNFANVARGVASNNNGFTLASQSGINLTLSGSSRFRIRHADTGVEFEQHANPYLTIASGSTSLSLNTAFITASVGKAVLVGGSSTTIVSGSDVFLDAGLNGVAIRRDSSAFATITSPSANTVTIAAAATYTTANIVNTVATTVNFAGGATTLLNMGATAGQTRISGSVSIPGTLNVTGSANFSGNTTFGDASGDTVTVNGTTTFVGAGITTTLQGSGSISGDLTVDGTTNLNGIVNLGNATGDDIVFSGRAASSLLPKTDMLYDLGAADKRWANMYTGDLHLRNDRGNWTIIEESDFLTITNNLNGKKYKFVMEEI